MLANKIRLVVDTNVWISFLIGKTLAPRFSKLLVDKRFEIVSSVQLFDELKSVLARPKFIKYISVTEVAHFLELFALATFNIEVCSVVSISSDLSDNFLLALAKDSCSQYLITGDKPHLLTLKIFENTQIITFSDFFNRFY